MYAFKSSQIETTLRGCCATILTTPDKGNTVIIIMKCVNFKDITEIPNPVPSQNLSIITIALLFNELSSTIFQSLPVSP